MADLPFHDYEAEMAVLACLISDKECHIDVTHFLKPSHFFVSAATAAYAQFLKMTREQGEPPDYVAWQKKLSEQRVITDKDNILLQAVNAFPIEAPLPSSIKDHAFSIMQAYKRRKYKEYGDKISHSSTDLSADIDEVGQYAQTAVLDIEIETDIGTSVQPITDVLARVHNNVERARDGKIAYLFTGYTDYDRLLDGIDIETYAIIAARPSMGKSSLMVGIILNMAMAGKKVLVFSLEMSAEIVVLRLLSYLAKVPVSDIRKGRMTPEQWQAYDEAKKTLAGLKIFVDDTPGTTPAQMRTKMRKQLLSDGLDIAMIDYLQLMESGTPARNIEQETSQISKATKATNKLLGVPIIALAQLSRGVEGRGDKRPTLSDLRGSGAIEQDADTVTFIYRDAYYNPDTTERLNIAELIIAKNRNGPTGVVDLYWHGQLMAFRDLQRQAINL